MVETRFDALVRVWGAGSRRALLRGLAAALAGTLGHRDPAPVFALGCIPPRRRCARTRWPPPLCCPGSYCYHGVCRQFECGFNKHCRNRGQVCCGGICTRLQADPFNCGACGHGCPTGYCLDGVCGCPAGLQACGAACVDLTSDPDHCGACGAFCPTGNCQDGRCGCDQDFTQCGSRCVNLDTDPAHCGTCETRCPSGGRCVGGQCQCPSGQQLCGSACVDVGSDPANCGGCGQGCSTGNCQMGRCGCNQGFDECGGACVDLQTDANNCGGCGVTCGAGGRCMGGQCCRGFGQACEVAADCCDNVPCINGSCHFPYAGAPRRRRAARSGNCCYPQSAALPTARDRRRGRQTVRRREAGMNDRCFAERAPAPASMEPEPTDARRRCLARRARRRAAASRAAPTRRTAVAARSAFAGRAIAEMQTPVEIAGRCGGNRNSNRSCRASINSCRRILLRRHHAFANTPWRK
jgi:stigma-specific protein Stig1